MFINWSMVAAWGIFVGGTSLLIGINAYVLIKGGQESEKD